MQEILDRLSRTARTVPGLRLLAMHGSRARGDAHGRSDWDFAYLAADGFDELALRAALAHALKTDDIDVADLARAGGLLRYRVAREGIALYEHVDDAFENFCYQATIFWLDAQDIIRSAHADVLGGLG